MRVLNTYIYIYKWESGTYLDVSFQIYLSSSVGVNRVLVSIESARIEANPTSILADGNRLSTNPECVLDIHIVQLEVVFMDPQCPTGIIGTSGSGGNTSLDCDLVRFIIGRVAGVAINLGMG
jgi:hypothetical protein